MSISSCDKTEAETFGDSFVMDHYLSNETLSGVTQAVKDAPWWVPVKGADWKRPEGPLSPTVAEDPDRQALFSTLAHSFFT